MNIVEIKPPYLIFLGDATEPHFAKTGSGLVQWRRELCKGQLSLEAGTIDLGLPSITISEAVEAGVGSIVIGIASIGGGLSNAWIDILVEALLAGIDVVAGFHDRLIDFPQLCDAAQKSGAKLIDVRVPPSKLPVGSGTKRSGRRLLTVGTDCALGKKYTALAIERDMRNAGMDVDFRASGQTGIIIAGRGIPIDAMVGDFITGAAELLSPPNSPEHWDVVEGQGSIFHPGYSPVSMGLLTGTQPDAFVVCHEAGRTRTLGWENHPLPSIQEVIERTMAIGMTLNPSIHCVGVSVNTSQLSNSEADAYLFDLSNKLGLPCVDPLRHGTTAIIDYLHTQQQTPAMTAQRN